jgi:hypothetical protein
MVLALLRGAVSGVGSTVGRLFGAVAKPVTSAISKGVSAVVNPVKKAAGYVGSALGRFFGSTVGKIVGLGATAVAVAPRAGAAVGEGLRRTTEGFLGLPLPVVLLALAGLAYVALR